MEIERRKVGALAATAAALLLVPTTGRAASDGDEAILAALDGLRKAMLAADKAALEALFLPEGTYGHSDGRLQTKDEFIADTVAKKNDWKSIAFLDPRITVSGDTAVARVLFTAEAEPKGKPMSVKITALVVYRHTGQGWKILSRQGYQTV